MGSLYKITNTVNDKAYIGQTIHDAEKTRISKHLTGNGSRIMKKAIEKYGQDAFTYEILHDGIIPEVLDDLEIETIKKFNTVAPNGYNLTTGGGGGSLSEETRRKMSEAQKGRTEEHRRRLSEAQTGNFHSEDTKRRISELQKGERAYWYGRFHSEDTKRKMSEAKRGKSTTWSRSPYYEEARQFFFLLPSDTISKSLYCINRTLAHRLTVYATRRHKLKVYATISIRNGMTWS